MGSRVGVLSGQMAQGRENVVSESRTEDSVCRGSQNSSQAPCQKAQLRVWGGGWGEQLRGVCCEGCDSKSKDEGEGDSWMEKEVGGDIVVRFA